MTEKEFEILKTEIRSVLLPNKEPVSIDSFKKQYKEMIGCYLPYRKFDFESELDFFLYIPDVVQVQNSRYGPVLTVVADDTTQHIKNMVSKQKPSTKKKSNLRTSHYIDTRTYASRTYGASSRTYAAPSRTYVAPPRTYDAPPRTYDAPPRFISKKPEFRKAAVLPADLKVEINDIIRSYRGGICLINVSIAYKRKFNKELDFQAFGFPTLEACIKASPEIAFKSRNNETVVYHIDEDNAKANERIPQSFNSNNTSSTPLLSTSSHPPGFSRLVEEKPKYSLEPRIEDRPKYIIPEQRPQDKPKYSIPESNVSDNHDQSLEDESEDKSGISEGMKQNFLKILAKYPNGISAADFPEKYKEISGSIFQLHAIGYFSLTDLVDALPKIFKRKNFNGSKREWHIYPAGESGFSKCSSEEEKPILNIKHIISNVRNILLACHEGIKVKDFLHVYNANLEDTLDLEMLGFDNVKHFLDVIADDIPFVFEGSKQNDTLSIRHYKYLDAVSSSDCGSISPPMNNSILDDIVPPDHQYSLQELVGDMSKCFPVFVATVMNPGLFYIQLKGKEMDGELLLLSEKLDIFYRGVHGNNYKMENKHVMIGATCAAVWPSDQHWYRVQITSIPSLEFVEAFYVDYGTKEKIPLTALRYLRKEFFPLPAQALKARIGGIQPPNGASRWDPAAGKKILELCSDKPLQAFLLEPSDPLSILLWDTNTDKDIMISRKLVEAGLAEVVTSDRNQRYPDSNTRTLQDGPNIPLNNFGIQQAVANNLMMSLSQNEAYLNAYLNVVKNSNPILANMNQQQLIAFLSTVNSGLPNPYGLQYPNQMLNLQQTALNFANAFNPMQFGYGGVHPNSSQMVTPTATSKIPAHTGKPSSSINTTATYASQQGHSSTQDNSGSDSEVFVDDDDCFKDFLSGQDPFSQIKPVRRVRFSDGYKMHIIVIKDRPYVSCGDVSALLWEDQDSGHLASSLKFKEISIPTLTICQNSNEELFTELKKYNVKGIDSGASVSLYNLKHVNDILSIFGHPSRTIRDEVLLYLRNFDPSDAQTDTEDLELEEAEKSETDRDKIYKMCSYDLKAMLEALRCKKLSILRDLREGKAELDVESVKRIESWGEMIKMRIKEIDELSTRFSNSLNEDGNHQRP